MQHVFILNPSAGKNDAAAKMVPQIKEAAALCGISPQLEKTQHPGHATELARQYAAAGGPVRLYAVGGDGTLNEVMAGAYQFPSAEVASVPCGSGNDFVRSFARPHGSTGAKPCAPDDFRNIPALISGTAMPIDLIQTDTGICLSITSTGMDADVAYNIPKYRRIPLLGGSVAYNLSVVGRMLKPLGKNVSVTVDGKTQTGCNIISTVCNGRFYGGGYEAAPMADLCDGLLDVVVVKKISLFGVLRIIGKYKQGLHAKDGEIAPEYASSMTHTRGKEVIITPVGAETFILNIDGECAPAKRLYAKILPAAGNFVLPAPRP